MTFPTIFGYGIGSLVVLGQVIIVVLLVLFFANKRESKIFKLLEQHGTLAAFIVSFIAMAGSLTYSDVIGYEPCKLCWFQRICMYPQFVILAIAIFRKDTNVWITSSILAGIGAVIALFHYMVQWGIVNTSCSTGGQTVSCATKMVNVYGYVTIPMMAFTAFIMIILFQTFRKKN
jgi:disulfide bond formation protein DsbB